MAAYPKTEPAYPDWQWSLPMNRLIFRQFRTIVRRLTLPALCLACLLPRMGASAQTKSPPPSGPDIRIEYFGSEKGYTVGSESVTFLCIVRNNGTAALPENSLRLRLFTLGGLDYTSGEITPTLPAMARNQAFAFRWRLNPTTERGPVAAGVLFEPVPIRTAASAIPSATGSVPRAPSPAPPTADEQLSAPSDAHLAVVPRLAAAPRFQPVPGEGGPIPVASALGDQARVGNDRVGVRVVAAEKRLPILLFVMKDKIGWRTLAAGTPAAQVCSGEEGQRPWWEVFRWESSRIGADANAATLILIGKCGSRWRAEFSLTAQRGTAAMNGSIRLTALQTMHITGVQFPRLPAETDAGGPVRTDGSPTAVPAEESPFSETSRISAVRGKDAIFGLTWPSALPLPGWHSIALPSGDGARFSLIGAQALAGNAPALVEKGRTITFCFRLFALSPAGDLHDALRFQLP